MISETQRDAIIRVLQPLGPKSISVFGSYARNENHSGSDLDVLVEFQGTVNLLDIIGAEMELTEVLGVQVDLLTKQAISPRLMGHINESIHEIFYAEK
ncbi:nucleotidyltransferase family protein [Litoribacter populi]|uniref:nucleotidyltransferase family protein n=1 Tax=Litoribacter populi TaxID=2598460 RepID=UPI00117EA23F|nr:nucleotidyltransferase family protein [Litoribacter populi]